MESDIDQDSDISVTLEKTTINHDNQHPTIKPKIDKAQLVR